MKKILYVLAVLGLIWLVKLSYDSYIFSAQLTAIQDELHKSEQSIANLNDQLVAAQRQSNKSLPVNTTALTQAVPEKVVGIQPTVLIKQKIALVQFALEQQQFVYAVDQLNQLDLDIEQYDLADTLRQGLHQAVSKDKQMIQHYVTERTAHLSQLNNVLEQVDQSLINQKSQMQLNVGAPEQTHFWQKWFKIDVVDQTDSSLVNRRLILKEVQLRVLLSQQALLRGDFVAYQSMLNLIDIELQSLPDAYSQKLRQTIVQVKQKQLNPIPKLSSSAILE
ncbi:hypothetical protein [Acinetobacter lanii]|uniref:Uncharacterized protein n=1 Tax=Acinetobacter lanii TaxID=2715163 RepID=A0A6G8S736_9GAMM|nr:hypothetical protein [Acinetobacter lanii]QIO10056.1 hypothetical protein G8D99_14270 [Acinetobacter lanii]